MNAKVDELIARAPRWGEEMEALRTLLLSCDLEEEVKWGKPCYTHQGSNVALIQAFKETVALLFFKGVLLQDPEGLLEPPGENSRTARRASFDGLAGLLDHLTTLRAYVQQAIALEQAGVELPREREETDYPEELRAALDGDPALKAAFEALTPGRQRAYVLHIAGAKQHRTRTARIEKYRPQILDGKGMHDR